MLQDVVGGFLDRIYMINRTLRVNHVHHVHPVKILAESIMFILSESVSQILSPVLSFDLDLARSKIDQ